MQLNLPKQGPEVIRLAPNTTTPPTAFNPLLPVLTMHETPFHVWLGQCLWSKGLKVVKHKSPYQLYSERCVALGLMMSQTWL